MKKYIYLLAVLLFLCVSSCGKPAPKNPVTDQELTKALKTIDCILEEEANEKQEIEEKV